MTENLPLFQVITFMLLGVMLACGLLFYLRHYKTEKKQKLLALGLFIASAIYMVFAIISMNGIWIAMETVGMLLFLLFIWMAFHYSMWFIVFGWALHTVWDVGIHPQETAPYVPLWYAWLCVGFDAIVAAYVSITLVRHETAS